MSGKRGGLLFVAVLLSGCHDEAEEQARVKAALPAGCELQDLGRYGRARSVFVVTCDGQTTRSTNSVQSSGKTTSQELQIQIEPRR